MKVEELMTREVATVDADTSLMEAAEMMRENDIGSLVVTDERRPVGMVTDRDLAVRASSRDWVPHEHTVEEVMTSNPVVITEDTDVLDAAHAIGRNKVRRLPVVDEDEELVGVISETDITSYVGQAMSDVYSEVTKSER